jgi:hypothetical protein
VPAQDPPDTVRAHDDPAPVLLGERCCDPTRSEPGLAEAEDPYTSTCARSRGSVHKRTHTNSNLRAPYSGSRGKGVWNDFTKTPIRGGFRLRRHLDKHIP